MGLRDRYQTPASSASPAAEPASPAPSTAPASPAAPSAASASSSPAAASAAIPSPSPASQTQPIPGSGAERRDLVALRARLQGSNGGVNPPEAAAAVKEDMLEPCTRETPDGGAEPLPNHPDAAKAGAAAASAPPAPDAGSPPKRKRRTRAEMEAARAAEAAAAAPVASPSEPATLSKTGSQVYNPPAPTEAEFDTELAAAAAETAGHIILTDELRAQMVRDIRQDLLQNLSLGDAINLVRERMFAGMKTLEIEK